jgi:hypothetical protein
MVLGFWGGLWAVTGQYEKHALVGNLNDRSTGKSEIELKTPCRRVSFYYQAHNANGNQVPGSANVSFYGVSGELLETRNLEMEFKRIFFMDVSYFSLIARITLGYRRAGSANMCYIGVDNMRFE